MNCAAIYLDKCETVLAKRLVREYILQQIELGATESDLCIATGLKNKLLTIERNISTLEARF